MSKQWNKFAFFFLVVVVIVISFFLGCVFIYAVRMQCTVCMNTCGVYFGVHQVTHSKVVMGLLADTRSLTSLTLGSLARRKHKNMKTNKQNIWRQRGGGRAPARERRSQSATKNICAICISRAHFLRPSGHLAFAAEWSTHQHFYFISSSYSWVWSIVIGRYRHEPARFSIQFDMKIKW